MEGIREEGRYATSRVADVRFIGSVPDERRGGEGGGCRDRKPAGS